MPSDVKLAWLTPRAEDGKPVETEGMAWEGKVPVGRVRRVAQSADRREWRWSMFAFGPNCVGAATICRAGAAATKDEAKADCERAYLDLIRFSPGNRQAIHEHHATNRKGAAAQGAYEGVRRSLGRR
jgi:hypothetical protein